MPEGSVRKAGKRIRGCCPKGHFSQAVRELHQLGIDSTTPADKAMFQMCGVFAEFERSIIRERINAGLAPAKSNEKTLGRTRVDPEVEDAIRQALERGNKGMRKIAREKGVGVSVVQWVKIAPKDE